MARTRRRPRKGRYAGLYKVLSILLVAAAIVTACVIFFRVHNIEVRGNERYSDAEIIAATGVREGANLFTPGWSQSARRLPRDLPYIDTVSISRELPDTVVITVTECRAAFRVAADDGGWWLLDAGGKLLEQTAQGTHPLITGVRPLVPAPGTRLAVHEDETARLDALIDLMTALRGEGMTALVQSIDLAGDYRITMEYGGRFSVELPFVTDFAYRMRWLKEAVEHPSVQEDRAYTVDMTAEGEARFIPK